MYPHSKDEDNNYHRHTNPSTSRRVEVKSTLGGLLPIDDVCVWMLCHGSCGTSFSSDLLVAGLEHSRPLVWLQDSVATGSG